MTPHGRTYGALGPALGFWQRLWRALKESKRWKPQL